jgi:hypothetical protein
MKKFKNQQSSTLAANWWRFHHWFSNREYSVPTVDAMH